MFKYLHNMQEKSNINRLKVVLAEKNKTNKWLARQIGKSETTVSRWCTNEVQPSLENLKKTALAIDVDIRELLNETK